LEQEADSSSGDDPLASAQAYATSAVAKAVEAGQAILAEAAAKGRADAEADGPAPLKLSALKQDIKATEKLGAKTSIQQKKYLPTGFHSAKLSQDSNGVYGAVNFGVTKKDSIPSSKGKGKRRRGTHLNKLREHDNKNIYGKKKTCLKDVAAHFDEKDIYEAKKISFLQQLDQTKSRKLAGKIRKKLRNLESWHHVMQQKFLASSQERKDQLRREEALFDAHLPQDLKDKLKANKVAKRAGQKLPWPGAHKEALAILRSKRESIARDDRLRETGHKVMIRPHITNPTFPSRDPISAHLREKIWRQVNTEKKWSTDSNDLERAERVVEKAHKQHGDFVEGPIAAPLLKGKLYKPETEPLGVPNFLHYFPWPKKPQDKVSMDDKVKVPQTYHQTW